MMLKSNKIILDYLGRDLLHGLTPPDLEALLGWPDWAFGALHELKRTIVQWPAYEPNMPPEWIYCDATIARLVEIQEDYRAKCVDLAVRRLIDAADGG